MNIQLGVLYVNKTYKYLVPCLKFYGETFVTKLSNTFVLAFGIHDCYLDGTPFEEDRLVYLLIDKAYQTAKFHNFIDYVKVQPYYITDYAYDDLENGRKHMLVVKFPEKYNSVYDKFNESQYSKMYTEEELNLFFYKEIHVMPRQVLTRDKKMKPFFLEKLNSTLGTKLELKDLDDREIGCMELDFPLEKVKEFFNYKSRES